jgi:predicted flap endonuclease-1-like 5' DNA nuclease
MSELKSDMADMQQGFRKDHTRMAGNMKDNLKAFMAETEAYVSNLKNDVVDMQASFRSDHVDMADKLKDDLQMFAAGIKSTVSDLEKQFHDEHAALSGKARAERQMFISNVKQSLADLKQQTADLLQNISSDLAGARRAWSGAPPTPSRKRTAEKVRRPAKEQAAQESTEDVPLRVRQPAKEQVKPDYLTQINGIGPVMSQRLNKAAIFTFSKLASSTIPELQKALGESARFANLEMWIKEARELRS